MCFINHKLAVTVIVDVKDSQENSKLIMHALHDIITKYPHASLKKKSSGIQSPPLSAIMKEYICWEYRHYQGETTLALPKGNGLVWVD